MIEDYMNYIQSTYDNYDTDSWYGEGIDILEALGDMSENLRKGDIQVFRNKSIDIFGRQQLKVTKDLLGVSEEEFKDLVDSVSFLGSYDPLGGDNSDIQFDTGSEETEEYIDDFDAQGYPVEDEDEDEFEDEDEDDFGDEDGFEDEDEDDFGDEDEFEDEDEDFAEIDDTDEDFEDNDDFEDNEDGDLGDEGDSEDSEDSDDDIYPDDEDDLDDDDDFDDSDDDFDDSDDDIYSDSDEDLDDDDDFDEAGNLNEQYENSDDDLYPDSDDDDFEDDDDFDESGNLNEQYDTDEDDFSDTDDFEDENSDNYVDPRDRNRGTINLDDGRLGSRRVPSQIINRGGSSADKTADGVVKIAGAILGLPKKLKTVAAKLKVTDEDAEDE